MVLYCIMDNLADHKALISGEQNHDKQLQKKELLPAHVRPDDLDGEEPS
jgi:hypothetical protein